MTHYYHNIGKNRFTYTNLYRSMVERFDDAVFLEIGSWKGRSVSFLGVEIKNHNKNIKVHCVDTWKGSSDHYDFDTLDGDDIYHQFLKNIKPIEDIVTHSRLPSVSAAQLYADEFFDFIFIDASHQFNDVMNDLNSWFPKLKKNGIFAGHDYGTWDGVTKAVDKWAEDNNFSITSDHSEHVWILQK